MVVDLPEVSPRPGRALWVIPRFVLASGAEDATRLWVYLQACTR